MPLSAIVASVSDHVLLGTFFKASFGREPDPILYEVEIGTNVGRSCVDIINKAAALLDAYTQASPPVSNASRKIVVSLAESACIIFIRG